MGQFCYLSNSLSGDYIMKNGFCPKCGSGNVYTKANGIVSLPERGGFLFVTAKPQIRGDANDDYVCTDCGYFESYVTDNARLRDIAKDWRKAA
jgi:predicted nucleic-acid-binding Zn-ribbon protein